MGSLRGRECFFHARGPSRRARAEGESGVSGKQPNDVDRLREAIVVKLTLLIGATRMPRVSKKQIEAALEQAIKDVQGWNP